MRQLWRYALYMKIKGLLARGWRRGCGRLYYCSREYVGGIGHGMYAFALSSLLWLSRLQKWFVWLSCMFSIQVERGDFWRLCISMRSARSLQAFMRLTAVVGSNRQPSGVVAMWYLVYSAFFFACATACLQHLSWRYDHSTYVQTAKLS